MAIPAHPLTQEDFFWGAVIIGGVVAAIAWQTLFKENEVDDEVLKVIPSTKLRKKIQQEDDDEESLSIAIETTGKRVGGVFRLPKHKRIYYYSFDFSDFPSQKFELANALVALVVFQSDIQFFRNRYKKLLLKTSNDIFLRYERHNKTQDLGKIQMNNKIYDAQRLLDKVQERLQFYKGQWREANSEDDLDMFQAKEVSKTSNLRFIPPGYNTYEISDWNVYSRLQTESNMPERIKTKFPHAVDDFY